MTEIHVHLSGLTSKAHSCSYCGHQWPWETYGEREALRLAREHTKTCAANPLIIRIRELEAELETVRYDWANECHDLQSRLAQIDKAREGEPPEPFQGCGIDSNSEYKPDAVRDWGRGRAYAAASWKAEAEALRVELAQAVDVFRKHVHHETCNLIPAIRSIIADAKRNGRRVTKWMERCRELEGILQGPSTHPDWRVEFTTLIGAVADALGLDLVDIPEKDCSCHLSPPCDDCVSWSALREAVSTLRATLAKVSK